MRVQLADLKPEFVHDLEEKYGEGASLEIRVLPAQQNGERLTEAGFWSILDSLDWESEGDDAVLAPAVQRLAAMPVSHIYQFQDKLAAKLYALDTRAHAQHIGSASWTSPEKPFSVDEFLYVRCCVVANGKDAYEAALHDPTQMPEDMDFEPLLYLASDAYALKFGKPFDYLPTLSFETFSNETGWK